MGVNNNYIDNGYIYSDYDDYYKSIGYSNEDDINNGDNELDDTMDSLVGK